MKKLLFFLVLIMSTIISCKQKKISKKTTEFSITNNGINNINLQECITIDNLQTTFPSYTIISKVGQQDGPDYRYFEVSKDNTILNFIMNEQKTCIINEINAQTNLEDMYGVKVGMTYEEVKKLRPNISHKTDFHFHTTLSEPNSNLQYEISGTYNGPDKQDFIYEEVKKWKVVQFIIREH